MKKIISMALAVAAFSMLLVSCNKAPVVTYKVGVTVLPGEEFPWWETEAPVFTVTFINTAGGAETVVSTENYYATANLVSGDYKVTASAKVSVDDKTYNLFGEGLVPVIKDEEITIVANAAVSSDLIFKEIYQSGCKIGEGEWDTYFRDQYYEIYNNSDNVVYADGLAIAQVNMYNFDYTEKIAYQIENPENYVFAQKIWQIPGDGATYPIKPGESIVIAQLGTDHNVESLANGHSPAGDLNKVEFEAILGESSLWDGTILPDGPAVNLIKAVSNYDMPQWLCSVGNAAMVIFKPSLPLSNDGLVSDESGSIYSAAYPILIEDVLDGVNIVSDETRISTLELPSSIDAGCIWHSAPGSYTGESISRKIAGTRADGTPIYQDSNNTTEDFVLNNAPVYHRDNVKSPSWNTWAK